MEGQKVCLYEKIQNVRAGLVEATIKKSGVMEGRRDKLYLELADFVGQLNTLMKRERMTAIVNFTDENATLTAYDFDSEQTLSITSPMRQVTVKGCNEMQNLGAAETYQRRYLYMAMFDIAESDLLDGGKPSEDDSDEITPPTDEQLKEAKDLGIEFGRLAAYLKKSVEDISGDDLTKAIKVKKEALARKAAKAEAENGGQNESTVQPE